MIGGWWNSRFFVVFLCFFWSLLWCGCVRDVVVVWGFCGGSGLKIFGDNWMVGIN